MQSTCPIRSRTIQTLLGASNHNVLQSREEVLHLETMTSRPGRESVLAASRKLSFIVLSYSPTFSEKIRNIVRIVGSELGFFRNECRFLLTDPGASR